MQFLGSDSGQTLGFCSTDRAAIDGAQEIVEQTLSGSSIIEHVSNQRRLRRFLYKIFQPHGSGVEALQKK